MNRDDITRMAKEAGFVGFDGDNGSLRRFAAIVAADEREACAKFIEEYSGTGKLVSCMSAAAAIRARGQA